VSISFEDGQWAHLPLVHEVRTHPGVAYVYSRLYGCRVEDLVVSPDRINYQLPSEWLLRGQKGDPARGLSLLKDAAWLHVRAPSPRSLTHGAPQIDQSLNKKGRHCIQGLVTLTDATQPGDASLEVVPSSHLLHDHLEDLMGRRLEKTKRRDDWLMFSQEDKEALNKHVHPVDGSYYEDGEVDFSSTFKSVVAPKGSLVLWDSRTMHQGGRIRACAEHPRADPSRPRFVIYSCMQPRYTWSDQQRAVKQQAFDLKRAMKHWPLAHLKGNIFGEPRYSQKAGEFNLAPHLLARPQGLLARFYGLEPAPALTAENPRVQPLLGFAPESSVRWPCENVLMGWDAERKEEATRLAYTFIMERPAADESESPSKKVKK